MRHRPALLLLVLAVAGAAGAAETEYWTADTAADLLEGHGDGVAVTTDGRLLRVPGWTTGVVFDEPVAMAGDLAPDGVAYVGTGHPARLYRVRDGAAERLAEVPEEQITAVAVQADGSVLVAAASPGVVYRWNGRRLEELARLTEGSVWDIVEFAGSPVLAAGAPAVLYRLSSRGLERWLELPDTHARSLAVAGDALVVGTSGKGLLFGVRRDGSASLLADSPFTEIAAVAPGPGGAVWAAAVVGEPAPAPTPSRSSDGEASDDSGSGAAQPLSLDLPKVGGKTASSELLRITPEGALIGVHRFADQVASAVAADGDGVLVATGYDGEVWRFVAAGGARLAAVDAVQVVRLLGAGRAALTQGPASLLWRQPDGAGPGRFRGAPESSKIPVRFGRYAVEPPADGVRIRFRTAAGEGPEEAWLPWTEWLPATGTVPLAPVRSLQWELELPAGVAVERVEVAVREVNLAPVLTQLEVEPPGVVYLGAPPPSGPVLDAANPDVSGIFTVIDPSPGGEGGPKQGKKYWRVGYRTVAWKAEDANGDALRFAVELERADGLRLPIREQLEATQLAVDTTAVPDGRYRFAVTADDSPSNPGDPQRAEALSPWFEVDSTPPTVELERAGDEWRVRVRDAGGLAGAEWSRDGDRWRALEPADGVLDGPEESFRFPAAEGRHLVVVRVVDRHHNRAVAGGEER